MPTKKAPINSLQKGSYVVLEDSPCVVTDVQTSKSGKHGHAKVRMTAVGLFDKKKREVVMPSHDNVDVPIVEKKTAQVLSINGDKANVMDTETYETFDLVIPEELKADCVEGIKVLYWDVLGEKVMKQIRGDTV